MFTDNFAFYNETERKFGIINLPVDATPIPLYGFSPMSLVSELRHENVWGNYLLSCLKTWNNEASPLYQIPNAVLGLIGEISEYLENPTIDEFGDITYYRAILCSLVGEASQIVLSKQRNNFDIATFTGLIADFAKKSVYHGKMYQPKTLGKYRSAMSMLDAFLWHELYNVHELTSFDTVFASNIEKLTNRHNGSGFNPNYDSQATN